MPEPGGMRKCSPVSVNSTNSLVRSLTKKMDAFSQPMIDLNLFRCSDCSSFSPDNIMSYSSAMLPYAFALSRASKFGPRPAPSGSKEWRRRRLGLLLGMSSLSLDFAAGMMPSRRFPAAAALSLCFVRIDVMESQICESNDRRRLAFCFRCCCFSLIDVSRLRSGSFSLSLVPGPAAPGPCLSSCLLSSPAALKSKLGARRLSLLWRRCSLCSLS
eukprot:gene12302-gene13189